MRILDKVRDSLRSLFSDSPRSAPVPPPSVRPVAQEIPALMPNDPAIPANEQMPNEADLAALVFTPNIDEQTEVDFQRPNPEGPTPVEREVLERHQNGLVSRRTLRNVITTSGECVPISQITCRCMSCNGYDNSRPVLKCRVCGISLCRLCAQALRHPTFDGIYCKKHQREAMRKWDVWHAMDVAKSRQAKIPIFPGKPMSVDSLRSQQGDSSCR